MYVGVNIVVVARQDTVLFFISVAQTAFYIYIYKKIGIYLMQVSLKNQIFFNIIVFMHS